MKPRNKFEKAVLAQSKKLRPITPIQINWAFRNCVEHYAHRLPKGRTTCMDCGHSWVMTEQTEHCTCPECGASLKVCLTYQRKVRQKQYFTTLTDRLSEMHLHHPDDYLPPCIYRRQVSVCETNRLYVPHVRFPDYFGLSGQ